MRFKICKWNTTRKFFNLPRILRFLSISSSSSKSASGGSLSLGVWQTVTELLLFKPPVVVALPRPPPDAMRVAAFWPTRSKTPVLSRLKVKWWKGLRKCSNCEVTQVTPITTTIRCGSWTGVWDWRNHPIERFDDLYWRNSPRLSGESRVTFSICFVLLLSLRPSLEV